METAIQVIWWIGLVGALVLTLVILKEVSAVLRTLNDIHRLAEHTRRAALGIAANTATGDPGTLRKPAEALREVTDTIAALSESIQRKLGAVR